MGKSRPSAADWSHLAIRQAAYDHHRIVTALKSSYTAPWVSTGRSKGGIAAVVYRRFFPNDVDATVPYAAPLSFAVGASRYLESFERSDLADCMDDLEAFQLKALGRKDDLLPIFKEAASNSSLQYKYFGTKYAMQSAITGLL